MQFSERTGSRWPRTIRIRQDASVTTTEPAIAVARDQVIDRVADHPWDEVEDPCPLPARKLARNAQRGFGFYIGLAGRHERKGSRAIRIDAQLLDAPDEKSGKAGLAPKSILNANKDAGNIKLDSETQLTGVPPEAWTYKLGNRSAVEWILDQYKEKTPKDPTIREKFNTYRFADHKEEVIDLLTRVTRVSVETMKIVEGMNSIKR